MTQHELLRRAAEARAPQVRDYWLERSATLWQTTDNGTYRVEKYRHADGTFREVLRPTLNPASRA